MYMYKYNGRPLRRLGRRHVESNFKPLLPFDIVEHCATGIFEACVLQKKSSSFSLF